MRPTWKKTAKKSRRNYHSVHGEWPCGLACSCSVAKVTSSSATLVGMWRVRPRPAHKTLHPGTGLLPLQTGNQWPHRRSKPEASFCSCFFCTWGSGPLAFGNRDLISENGFTSALQSTSDVLCKQQARAARSDPDVAFLQRRDNLVHFKARGRHHPIIWT